MTSKRIPPTPDYDEPKELYAFFGLAFYKANVLEHGVLNLAVALLAKEDLGITVDELMQLYEKFDDKTFGHIVNLVKQKFSFPNDFVVELELALKHRNYLAHGFYKKHDIDHMSSGGRKLMIDELIEIWTHLAEVDEVMDGYWMSAWEAHGITNEWIEKQMGSYVQTMRSQNA